MINKISTDNVNENTSCVVAILKQEESFVDEWLLYHKLLGVDHFFLYDDDPNLPLEDIVKEHAAYTTVIPWQETFRGYKDMGNQIGAYIHSVENFVKSFKWVAFVDADEFIVLKKHANLKEFLSASIGTSISLNWLIFGHNGYFNDPKGFVTSSLTRRMKNPSPFYKTITRTDAIEKITNPHYCHIKLGDRVDANNKVFQEEMYPGKTDTAHINHYQCRSFSKWMERASRGDVNFNSQNCGTEHKWRTNKDLLLREFVTNIAYDKNEFFDNHMVKYKFDLYESLYTLKNSFKQTPLSLDYEIEMRIKHILSTIAGRIIEVSGTDLPIGLLTGKSGIVLFLSYYSRFTSDLKYLDLAENLIEEIYEDISVSTPSLFYSDGLAGLGITIEHLVQNCFLQIDTDEILEDLDGILAPLKGAIFSTMGIKTGTTGTGKYFCSRLSSTLKVDRNKSYSVNVDSLNSIFDTLEHPFDTYQDLTSVLHFLGDCYEHIKNKPKALRYVYYAIDKLETMLHEDAFFMQHSKEFNPLTASLSMCKLSEVINDLSLKERARFFLSMSESVHINNLNKMRGGSDLGYLKTWLYYLELYQYLDDDKLKLSSYSWLNIAIAEAQNFLKSTDGKTLTADEITLSSGLSGIGLALLAAVDEHNHNWVNDTLISS